MILIPPSQLTEAAKQIYGSKKKNNFKRKRWELHLQLPFNSRNHALFVNFLNNDSCEKSVMDKFWHDALKVTFPTAEWKDPCFMKSTGSVLIWGTGQVCVLSQEENEARCILEVLAQ